MALTNHLNEIADAIREKTGSQGELTLAQMPAAIRKISTTSSPGSVIAPAASNYPITQQFSAIGNAIRSKTGGTAALTLAQMPDAIRSIAFVNSTGFAWAATSDLTGVNITGIGTCEDTTIAVPYSIYVEGIVPPNRPVKGIAEKAFYDNDNITRLIVPANINEEFVIMDGAFQRCSNLTSVSLGGTYMLRRDGAQYGPFAECYNLETVDFGTKLRHIGAYCFYNCIGLKQITLPASLNASGLAVAPIASTAFSGCTNLTDIYVPWGPDDYYGNRNAPWGAENATIHYNSGGEQ